MGGVDLLAAARVAGLRVRHEGNRLVMRGPKRLEPLVCQLLEAKAEVLAALRDEDGFAIPPLRPCRMCRGRRFWRHVHGGHFICDTCHPAPALELVAESIVLAPAISEDLKRLLERYGWEPCEAH